MKVRLRLLILLPLALLSKACAVAFGGNASVAVDRRLTLEGEIGVGKEKGPVRPGLNTKSTQDFSDPEKDQAPKRDTDKKKPVRP